MNKTRIRTNLNYSIIIQFVIALLLIGLLIFMLISFPAPQTVLEYCFIVFLPISAVIMAYAGLIYYQTAILDENGIRFKGLFHEIAYVEWTNIRKIEIKELPTLHSSIRALYYKWIILYTDTTQSIEHGGTNKKGKPPWQIKYNKKNAEIVNDYLQKYSCFTIELPSDSKRFKK